MKTKKCQKRAGDLKRVVCEECGKEFYTRLILGDKELRDGYHGECPGGFCGYWYFEKV